MPISHKISQYRALLGFAAPGRNSPIRGAGWKKSHTSREYGRVLSTKF